MANINPEKLDALCNLVEQSDDALYAHLTIHQILQTLQNIRNDLSQTGSLNESQLAFLLAPTGPIQEVSIDNGWGEKFLQLAKEIDAGMDYE